MNELLADLETAEFENYHERRCPVCVYLEGLSDEEKPAVTRAVAGTIGSRRLSVILNKHGHKISDRQIRKHRAESETAQ